MKKMHLLLAVCSGLSLDAVANGNLPDDVVVTKPVNVTKNDVKSTCSYWGLGFYSYDGSELYGLSFGSYNFNGIGGGINLRSTLKFGDDHDTFNTDLALNYSFGISATHDIMFLITPEIGPSFGSRKAMDSDGKLKDKFFVDAFIGLKATLNYKKLVLSAGYHVWAAEWKFGKNYKADGFYAQLGFDF